MRATLPVLLTVDEAAELLRTTVSLFNDIHRDDTPEVVLDVAYSGGARPYRCIGHDSRLSQVIVNLLDNAIKFTAPGGQIHVRVSLREQRAILEVTDNGMGMPPEAIPHVFERFFRVDKARSRDLGGAGLGLSIVKSICLAHRGRVEVESKEGHGSRFIVELPLASQS